MTTIRLAEIEDLEIINEIYNWAVLNTIATFDIDPRSPERAKEWFIQHNDPIHPLWVMELDKNIVGWGSISAFHPRPAYRLTGEFSLYIQEKYQGRGLGTQFLDYIVRSAELLNYHSLIGLITAQNIASLALAQKHGFKEVGHYVEVGFKFNRWLDVAVVQKMLI